jgi:hypothetical protein
MLLPRVAGRDFPPPDLVEVIVVEIFHTNTHLTMFKDSSPKLACPNGVPAVVSPGCCSSLETGTRVEKLWDCGGKIEKSKKSGPGAHARNGAGGHQNQHGMVGTSKILGNIAGFAGFGRISD